MHKIGSGIEFPARISLYERDDETATDYEIVAPGLGCSVAYAIPEIRSRTMTAYSYDRGLRGIPDGVSNAIVQAEFERATFEAFNNSRLYDDVELTGEGVCGFEGAPKFLYVAATFTTADLLQPRASLMALTAYRGKFLKLRITQPPGAHANDDMTRVVDHWSEWLWSIGD